MFDQISSTYDQTNRWITFGKDLSWRKKMARHLPKGKLKLLDLATGTADQILALLGNIDSAVGIDLSQKMLKIAREKCAAYPQIKLRHASALDIPYPDHTFDVTTMTFGIRNVTDTQKALQEMLRVLKPGAKALIIEGSMIENRCLQSMQRLYLRYILPRLGGLISGHQKPYRYLNQTIETYPFGEQFLELMRSCGFDDVYSKSFTFGSVRLYAGSKPLAKKTDPVS